MQKTSAREYAKGLADYLKSGIPIERVRKLAQEWNVRNAVPINGTDLPSCLYSDYTGSGADRQRCHIILNQGSDKLAVLVNDQ